MLPINKASQLTQCSICSGQYPVPHRVGTCSAPTAKSIVLRSSTYRMQRKVLFSKVLVYEFIVMLLYYEPVLFQCYIFFFLQNKITILKCVTINYLYLQQQCRTCVEISCVNLQYHLEYFHKTKLRTSQPENVFKNTLELAIFKTTVSKEPQEVTVRIAKMSTFRYICSI